MQNISTLDIGHGKIYTDLGVGGLEWSKDERFIVYTAESPSEISKGTPYYPPQDPKSKTTDESKSSSSSSSSSSAPTTNQSASTSGKKFEYDEDWGEQFSHVKRTDVWVLSTQLQDQSTGISRRVPTSPKSRVVKINLPKVTSDEKVFAIDEIHWSQPRFTPNGTGLILAGSSILPRRLGRIYCK